MTIGRKVWRYKRVERIPVRTASGKGQMAQSGERRRTGKIRNMKVRERSESTGSVEEFFKRKRDRMEEEERDEEKRAFQRSKKTPRSLINTMDDEIINKIYKKLKKELKGIMEELKGVKGWKITIKELKEEIEEGLKEQERYIKEELEGVKKECRERGN